MDNFPTGYSEWEFGIEDDERDEIEEEQQLTIPPSDNNFNILNMGNKVRISLFENNKKLKDSHPDYSASFKKEDTWVNVIAGWKNETKNGRAYINLSLDLEGLKDYIVAEKDRVEKMRKEQTPTVEADTIIDPDQLPF